MLDEKKFFSPFETDNVEWVAGGMTSERIVTESYFTYDLKETLIPGSPTAGQPQVMGLIFRTFYADPAVQQRKLQVGGGKDFVFLCKWGLGPTAKSLGWRICDASGNIIDPAIKDFSQLRGPRILWTGDGNMRLPENTKFQRLQQNIASLHKQGQLPQPLVTKLTAGDYGGFVGLRATFADVRQPDLPGLPNEPREIAQGPGPDGTARPPKVVYNMETEIAEVHGFIDDVAPYLSGDPNAVYQAAQQQPVDDALAGQIAQILRDTYPQGATIDELTANPMPFMSAGAHGTVIVGNKATMLRLATDGVLRHDAATGKFFG